MLHPLTINVCANEDFQTNVIDKNKGKSKFKAQITLQKIQVCTADEQ